MDAHTFSSKSAVPLVEVAVGAVMVACAILWFGDFVGAPTLLAFPSAGAVVVLSLAAWGVRARASMPPSAEAMLGPYALGPKIGQGGMGEVYRARHAMMARDVAIKILPEGRVDEEACARFEREARLTSRLESPNTVAVHDYGRTPDGRPYYVMELVDGYDLDHLVRRFGPQPAGRVVRLLEQVCSALEEAHAVGLVHRDIKPANIALCERAGVKDVVKVLDFGLVEEVGKSSTSERRSLVGTPAYLAPESILTPESIDARIDLYALGAVAYWLLTGTEVFEGDSIVELCSHHIHTDPQTPSLRLGRPVPSELEAVVMRCLAKDPGRRYASARALREALYACEASATWDAREAERWSVVQAGEDRAAAPSFGESRCTLKPFVPALWGHAA